MAKSNTSSSDSSKATQVGQAVRATSDLSSKTRWSAIEKATGTSK